MLNFISSTFVVIETWNIRGPTQRLVNQNKTNGVCIAHVRGLQKIAKNSWQFVSFLSCFQI